MRKKSYVLIGFMGSGKTTVGEELAKELGVEFIDTDAYIVENQGCSINEIFERMGEEYFRNLESEAVKELSQTFKPMVLSVGGGLVMRDINVGYLKAIGQIVYLRASVDTLCARLEGDDTRPLLKGTNLRGRIEELMAKRKERYEEVADVVIDTDDKKVLEIVRDIGYN